MSNVAKAKPKANVIDISVGKRLKALRAIRGFSQEKIAHEIGVSFQQIQKYEQGKNRLSASRIYTLSKVLQVDINDFFSSVPDKQNTSENNLSFLDTLSKESLELIKLFDQISDKKTKKALVNLLGSFLTKTE